MVRRQGAQAPASCASTTGLFNAQAAFEPSAECEGPAIDVPEARVACLKAALFAHAGGWTVAPVMVPPEARVGTDVAPLDTVGGVKRRPSVGQLTGCGGVACGWGVRGQRLVRALAVARRAAALQPELRSPPSTRGRAGGACLPRTRPALRAAGWLGCAGPDAFGEAPPAAPPGGEWGEPAQGRGGEGHTVVGAEALGPAERFEEPGEHGRGVGHTGGGEGLAAAERAAVAIGPR